MTQHYHSGYDILTPGPGTVVSACCRACGTEMVVERNVLGPTGQAEALSGRKHMHDRFVCPHAGEKWHTMVIRIIEESRGTVSLKLKAILLGEADEILSGYGKRRLQE